MRSARCKATISLSIKLRADPNGREHDTAGYKRVSQGQFLPNTYRDLLEYNRIRRVSTKRQVDLFLQPPPDYGAGADISTLDPGKMKGDAEESITDLEGQTQSEAWTIFRDHAKKRLLGAIVDPTEEQFLAGKKAAEQVFNADCKQKCAKSKGQTIDYSDLIFY